MSVFTTVTIDQLAEWLKGYSIGTPVESHGIAAGIENTNYFVTTTQGRYVLTLFERLSAVELPFYLDLMAHLAKTGIPCPLPIESNSGSTLGLLNGKPTTLVTRLPGSPEMSPSIEHCRRVGEVLGRMHIAGKSYPGRQENPRGPAWCEATAPKIDKFLDDEGRELLRSELKAQSAFPRNALPRGPIHADLFRDNVLWSQGGSAPQLGGVIDFYFAGVDALLFDVAVTANDWCVDATGQLEGARLDALMKAYTGTRLLETAEQEAWPMMLRAAALRFWLSRLFDFYVPRDGELTHAHDPEHFRRILERRRASTDRIG